MEGSGGGGQSQGPHLKPRRRWRVGERSRVETDRRPGWRLGAGRAREARGRTWRGRPGRGQTEPEGKDAEKLGSGVYHAGAGTVAAAWGRKIKSRRKSESEREGETLSKRYGDCGKRRNRGLEAAAARGEGSQSPPQRGREGGEGRKR